MCIRDRDTTFYDKAARMLKIPRSELERLRPKYNGLVLIEKDVYKRQRPTSSSIPTGASIT